MKPITLVISSLGAGGAERVASVLARGWCERGHDVTIVTLDDAEPFYDLPAGVVRHGLGLSGPSTGFGAAIVNNLRRVAGLRRALAATRGGAIVSFGSETNCLAILAGFGLGRRLVVSERCDPNHLPARRTWRLLRRATYRMADRVVAQTADAARFFHGWSAVRVIANPVVPPPPDGDAPPPTGKLIVGMGRLVRQKGFDILIESFAKLADRYPDWTLAILGEGPERPALEAQIARLGLTGRVALRGLVAAPEGVLRQAALFALPSRFEGFPNALCEAMACGVAVVAADCESGPRDIVTDGVDGILTPVEDAAALERALDVLMGDEARRRRLAANAVHISQRYSLDHVMALWDDVLTPP